MSEREWPSIDGVDGWFQGNIEPFTDEYFLIEGTYTIFTGRLTRAQDDALGQIFPQLPGQFRINPKDGMPYWYGQSDDEIPHLTASFEPSGIVVSGVVQQKDWAEWDAKFRQLVDEAKIPRFPA